MSPTLRLVHYLCMNRKELWQERAVREMANAVYKENTTLLVRVAELEKERRSTLRFQGMTDLA